MKDFHINNKKHLIADMFIPFIKKGSVRKIVGWFIAAQLAPITLGLELRDRGRPFIDGYVIATQGYAILALMIGFVFVVLYLITPEN